jgi:AraC family transcriptional regulator of adaptative response/methylated-DNA-[protein]-cysteine methyltransferase
VLAAVVARVQVDIGGADSSETVPMPPVDIHATAFQWRVWQALQKMRGSTRAIPTSLPHRRAALGARCP